MNGIEKMKCDFENFLRAGAEATASSTWADFERIIAESFRETEAPADMVDALAGVDFICDMMRDALKRAMRARYRAAPSCHTSCCGPRESSL